MPDVNGKLEHAEAVFYQCLAELGGSRSLCLGFGGQVE
jgi:hypothetical protein